MAISGIFKKGIGFRAVKMLMVCCMILSSVLYPFFWGYFKTSSCYFGCFSCTILTQSCSISPSVGESVHVSHSPHQPTPTFHLQRCVLLLPKFSAMAGWLAVKSVTVLTHLEDIKLWDAKVHGINTYFESVIVLSISK